MRLETPLALLLLCFLPFFFDHWKRRKNSPLATSGNQNEAFLFAAPVVLENIPRSTLTRVRDPILRILQILSFTLFVVALARPQTGTHFTEIEESGRDIILTLDTSGSMQAMDFTIDGERVSRLEALQHVVKDFAEKRKGDRIGLTVFGTHAFTQCPLTLDTIALQEFVERLEIGMSGKGTAIGDALAVSLKQIRNIESKSKVIVLVTDGKTHNDAIPPKQAANEAKKLGVKVYTIGIGGQGTAPFPTQSFFGRTRLVNRKVDFDEDTLKEIAEITGGMYFNAKNTEALQQVYAEINKIEERIEKTFEFVEYREHFFLFVALGFALFVTHELLASTLLLQIP